jgi:AraC-like DNA-binding protein
MEVMEHSGLPDGVAHRIGLGAGHLWRVLYAGQRVRRRPRPFGPGSTSALVIQQEGVTEFVQGERHCRLLEGELCLLDGTVPLELETLGVSAVLIIEFPHVMGHAAEATLFQKSGLPLQSALAEAQLLKTVVDFALAPANGMTHAAGAATLELLLKLIAALPPREAAQRAGTPWRITRALQDIELLYGDSHLSPATIAERQRISRRRLDLLFVQHTRMTVAAHIQEHRLLRAAAELDSGTSRSITEIGYRMGFKDPAHFSRAFRQRFGAPPSRWRKE